MNKEKVVFRLNRYVGDVLQAKKEISFEIKLSSRLILDELCFNWNKNRLENAINQSLDDGDQVAFKQLSKQYIQYIGK